MRRWICLVRGHDWEKVHSETELLQECRRCHRVWSWGEPLFKDTYETCTLAELRGCPA